MKIFEFFLPTCFALLGFCCAFGTTEPAFSLQKDYLGATGYPRMVGLLLVALCLAAPLRSLRALKTAASDAKAPEIASLRHAAAPIALAVAYVAGIAWAGFIISTFIYLCIMPGFWGGGASRAGLLKNLFYAGLVTGVIEIFFKLFKVYLPTTILF